MKARPRMMLYYASLSIAIISTALYHISQRATPRGANPPISLMITYGVAMILTAALLYCIPAKEGLLVEARKLNWASYLLALSIVGLEVGFLLAYRSGWNIGLAAVVVNVAAALLLVPVALLVFEERLNVVNLVGIVVCLAGLMMLNWRR